VRGPTEPRRRRWRRNRRPPPEADRSGRPTSSICSNGSRTSDGYRRSWRRSHEIRSTPKPVIRRKAPRMAAGPALPEPHRQSLDTGGQVGHEWISHDSTSVANPTSASASPRADRTHHLALRP
jgi:hypothetical protein